MVKLKTHPPAHNTVPDSKKAAIVARMKALQSQILGDFKKVTGFGKKAGIVLNPATPVSVVDEVMDMVDLILVMSVNPGFGGQAFIESQLTKISALRTRIDNHVAGGGQPIDLEVDGGIDRKTAPLAIAAGANVLVAGTATFKGGPDAYADNIAAMRAG